jgi:F0F1-type ATP synthase assembly protein I
MSSDGQKRTPLTGLHALGFVTDVLISVALPTTFFAWVGRSLDTRWNTSPWMTVIGFVFAITISGLLVYRKAKQYQKQILMK